MKRKPFVERLKGALVELLERMKRKKATPVQTSPAKTKEIDNEKIPANLLDEFEWEICPRVDAATGRRYWELIGTTKSEIGQSFITRWWKWTGHPCSDVEWYQQKEVVNHPLHKGRGLNREDQEQLVD
ncbi:hypothetical protein LCGC14_3096160 [marine sediment metagenome]|uniref:Uncharacterized protein n=1 Tax=marine sediment metagenome TaxID=412755 RepID=A0A0F8YZA7_9ZZZZ